ncbi:M14 family metallopeptidase [Staphylococcus hominis]|uniref:M14 family metallopeptidase n=1 Tax=Staphylococcus hominis TaxID=1290 RepID=UPI0011A5C6E2|nr:M14 family metallopeptidase [Staphylococcus hominis]
MGIKTIDAFWDRENLFNLNENFQKHDKKIEEFARVSLDIINKEMLSAEEFEQLQITLNGLLKRGDVSVSDINTNLGKIGLSHLADEVIQAIAGTASVNAIPSDLSITTNKIANNAITPEKASFINGSDNLLNKNDVIANKNLDSNTGELINSSVSSVFNTWLPVSEGEVYTANSINTRVYYKSDKTFLSAVTGYGTFTIPTGASYMRISTPRVNEAQLNRGSELLDYDEYREQTLSSEIKINKLPDNIITTPLIKNNTITPEKTTFVRLPKNLIDKNSLIQGKSLNSKGEVSENSIFYITDYIPIKENETYTASSSPQNRVIFYDESKNYIDYGYNPENTITFTTPEKTAYVRLNVHRTFKDTPMLNKGTELLPYEDWHEPYLEGITAGNNIDSEKVTEEIIQKIKEKTPIKDGKTFTLDTSLDLNYTPETIQGCSDNDPLPMGQIQYTDMYGMYDELCNKYPNYVSRKVEGKDILEDEIISYTFKPEEQSFTRNSEEIEKTFKRFKFFIVSSTHGNERTSIWVLYNLMKLICEKWQTNESLEFLRWNVEFVICPIISPGGYRNFTRINANGVDLNRNFDADWENGSSDKSNTTYRGDAPMSEPEAIVCDNIIKRENPNFVIDFHNFHAQSTPTSFNWIIGYSDKVNDIADLVLSKMARKWKKQYPDLPQDVVGFGYGSPGIQVGSLTNYAQKKYGIPSSLFEVCWKMDAKTDSIKRDSFISTIGLDSFSNFLLQIANNANEL